MAKQIDIHKVLGVTETQRNNMSSQVAQMQVVIEDQDAELAEMRDTWTPPKEKKPK